MLDLEQIGTPSNYSKVFLLTEKVIKLDGNDDMVQENIVTDFKVKHKKLLYRIPSYGVLALISMCSAHS